MFMRDNFDQLCDAIDIITINEDHSLKAGLRQKFVLSDQKCSEKS